MYTRTLLFTCAKQPICRSKSRASDPARSVFQKPQVAPDICEIDAGGNFRFLLINHVLLLPLFSSVMAAVDVRASVDLPDSIYSLTPCFLFISQ